jgi:hypothetical protein
LVTVVIALLTSTLCEDDESVKAGAASVGALDEEEVGEVLTIFSARVVIGAGEVAALDEPFML